MSTPANTPGSDPQDPNRPQYGEYAPQPPQYGQNAPQQGQPQYGEYGQQGQPQYPGYGYQAGPPAYSYPGGQGDLQAQQKGPAPKRVNTAYWLIIAAGAVNLLAAVLMSLNPLASITPDQLTTLEDSGVDPSSLTDLFSSVVIVFAVISLALYVLIAVMIRRGKNWARITGTVFAALSIFSIASGFLAAISVLLGITGIVLCYLKPSNEYFAKRPLAY